MIPQSRIVRAGGGSACRCCRGADAVETCSAAVDLCRVRLAGGKGQAVLINAGNANAFTGRAGQSAVARCADAVATACGCPKGNVLLASTGVIGEPLDDSLITGHLDAMIGHLSADGWADAAEAIRTTDTLPAKGSPRRSRSTAQPSPSPALPRAPG